MARPSLGSAAKNKPATVRLTPREAADLTRIFGSPSKGLRAILDQWKTTKEKP